MTTPARSTIAALCYADHTGLSFEALTTELAQALGENPQYDMRMSAKYDDFVSYDLPGVQICLSHSNLKTDALPDTPPSPYAECFLVSVGTTREGEGHGPMFSNRIQLTKRLVGQIEARYPADWFLMQDRPEYFDEDLSDQICEQIAAGRPAFAAPPAEAEADAPPADPVDPPQAAPEKPERAHPFEPIRPTDILSELAARYDTERAAREHARAETHAKAEQVWFKANSDALRQATGGPSKRRAGRHERPPSFDAPPKPAAQAAPPKQTKESYLRSALHPETGDALWDGEGEPLVHRAAIHSLNAAVLAFSLPAGAILITLGVLGRESLLASSRMTALTGSAIGFSHTEIPMRLLSLI